MSTVVELFVALLLLLWITIVWKAELLRTLRTVLILLLRDCSRGKQSVNAPTAVGMARNYRYSSSSRFCCCRADYAAARG